LRTALSILGKHAVPRFRAWLREVGIIRFKVEGVCRVTTLELMCRNWVCVTCRKLSEREGKRERRDESMHVHIVGR